MIEKQGKQLQKFLYDYMDGFDIWKFRMDYDRCIGYYAHYVKQIRENRNNISIGPNILAPQFDYQ